MIEALVIGFAVLTGVAVGVLTVRARRERPVVVKRTGRILFPFVGSRAVRARASRPACGSRRPRTRVLVPAYLVSVPMALTLDAPLPRACNTAFELLEAIEQRAAAAGVPVDARIGRGRTLRHAMRD